MIEYGLIGAKLGHSYSKPIHNRLADYEYELYEVTPEELACLMTKRNFRGLNVTIPYKKDVLPYLDVVSDEVREVGSANTLVMETDGKLHGYNTDLAGFLYMADLAGVSMTDKKVVILGSGGTSLMAQAAARRRSAREIVVVSRTGAVNYENLYKIHADAQVLINATPVGMYPNNGVSPVRIGEFAQLEGVLDVIYNPRRTALLLDAQERGIPCTDGLSMLVAQARYAAEHFTGHPIAEEKVKDICVAMRAQTENLVLVGMPGSGKSSLGRAIAEKMKREFVDMDALIEQRTGKHIPDIFQEQGEDGFRHLESEVARDVGKENGLVIATGGGVVKRPENMRALRQNGEILWIKRPLEILDMAGRPLSAGREALETMYAERRPLYEKYAAGSVENAGTLEETADAAREAFYEAVNH